MRFAGFEGEWEAKRLGDVAEVKTGNKDTQNKIDDGLYPFFVRSNSVERINTYSFDGEAILTSGDGVGVGKNFHYIDGRFDFHQRVYSIRNFKKGFNGKYIFNIFSNQFYDRVIRLSAKNSVDSVRMSMITDMKLYFPLYSEQQKIASFLSLIDNRIQAQIKIIKGLETLMVGLREKLFKQQIRFNDENGKNLYKWHKKRLGELCNEHQLKNKKNEHNEVFSVAKHKGVINQIEHLGRSFSSKEISHYKLIYPGDLVYTKSPTSDFPFGIIKQNRTGRIGVVSPLYCVFKPETFELGYLIHEYFRSAINTYNYLNPLVQKGAKNTMNINNKDFLNGAELPLPTNESEQSFIANFLTSINKKIGTEKKILAMYELQKKYLLKNLFV